MWIDITFIIVAVICFIILIYDKAEYYRIMSHIRHMHPDTLDTPGGEESKSLKYHDSHRYSRRKQRRARGQIRNTGENR